MKRIRFTRSYGRFYDTFVFGYTTFRGFHFKTEFTIHFGPFNMILGLGEKLEFGPFVDNEATDSEY